MQNILAHFSRFLRFCQETVHSLRKSAPLSTIPLNFPEILAPAAENLEFQTPQFFVMEFSCREKKASHAVFLMEQWIFSLHADKLPRNSAKIVRTEAELSQILQSVAKTVANLCVNLPLFREFLRPSAKYAAQLGYDFELVARTTRELAKISNFQGWDSQKWSRFYSKFPLQEDCCFYVFCGQVAYKFSFRVNFFEDVFNLYKVLEPAKKFRERCVSENVCAGIAQENAEIGEEVAWTAERRASFEESCRGSAKFKEMRRFF